MSVSINPIATSNAAGSFQTQSLGYIQGTALNDPTVRNLLSGGVLNPAAALPMWGGIAIEEFTNDIAYGSANTSPNGALGGQIDRAPDNTHVTGFSVFDQNHAMVNSPGSPVPLASQNMLVNFYRLGSNARIAVKCDPALVSLEGAIISQQVSWDFVNQQLIAYSGGVGALACKVLEVAVGNSMTVSYDAGTGLATWVTNGTTAIILI